MHSLRMSAAIVLDVTLLCPPVVRANCCAEGCPLVRDGLGAIPRRFAFDLRYQDVTQDKLWSGGSAADLADVIADADTHGEVELYTRTRSWVAEGRARITDRLRLSVTLPYIQREHRHWLHHTPTFNPLFLDAWKYEGLADATLLGNFRAFELAGGTSLALQGGVKLPTGRTHLPDETRNNGGFDSTLEPSARPGTGSTDWLAGGMLTQRLPWKSVLPLSASLLGRWNTKGTDDFQVGDEVQAGLSGDYAPWSWLTLLAQVNYSAHGSDISADAAEAAHTGMHSLFVTPGVSVRVSPAISLYGIYQARAWSHSDEATVVATDHFLFGTTYSIGR